MVCHCQPIPIDKVCRHRKRDYLFCLTARRSGLGCQALALAARRPAAGGPLHCTVLPNIRWAWQRGTLPKGLRRGTALPCLSGGKGKPERKDFSRLLFSGKQGRLVPLLRPSSRRAPRCLACWMFGVTVACLCKLLYPFTINISYGSFRYTLAKGIDQQLSVNQDTSNRCQALYAISNSRSACHRISEKGSTVTNLGISSVVKIGFLFPKEGHFFLRMTSLIWHCQFILSAVLHVVSRMNVKHDSHLPSSPSSFHVWVIFLSNKPLISLLPSSPHNRVGKTTYQEKFKHPNTKYGAICTS